MISFCVKNLSLYQNFFEDNLFKQNQTTFCVQNRQVFGLYMLNLERLPKSRLPFNVRLIQDSSLFRVLFNLERFPKSRLPFNVRLIQDSSLFRVLFNLERFPTVLFNLERFPKSRLPFNVRLIQDSSLFRVLFRQVSEICTLTGQRYFRTKVFPYIFHLKPFNFKTSS